MVPMSIFPFIAPMDVTTCEGSWSVNPLKKKVNLQIEFACLVKPTYALKIGLPQKETRLPTPTFEGAMLVLDSFPTAPNAAPATKKYPRLTIVTHQTSIGRETTKLPCAFSRGPLTPRLYLHHSSCFGSTLSSPLGRHPDECVLLALPDLKACRFFVIKKAQGKILDQV